MVQGNSAPTPLDVRSLPAWTPTEKEVMSEGRNGGRRCQHGQEVKNKEPGHFQGHELTEPPGHSCHQGCLGGDRADDRLFPLRRWGHRSPRATSGQRATALPGTCQIPSFLHTVLEPRVSNTFSDTADRTRLLSSSGTKPAEVEQKPFPGPPRTTRGSPKQSSF